MRALGPGSVSSFLKIILDVVFAALWIGVVALSLITLAALLLSFNPDLLANLTQATDPGAIARDSALGELASNGPSITSGLLAEALAAFLAVLDRATLAEAAKRGQPA